MPKTDEMIHATFDSLIKIKRTVNQLHKISASANRIDKIVIVLSIVIISYSRQFLCLFYLRPTRQSVARTPEIL